MGPARPHDQAELDQRIASFVRESVGKWRWRSPYDRAGLSVLVASDGRRALVTVPDPGLVVTVDAVERRVLDSARVPLKPGALGWFSCPDGRCGSPGSRWRKGGTGLPGEHWSKADLIGDLWCGG